MFNLKLDKTFLSPQKNTELFVLKFISLL